MQQSERDHWIGWDSESVWAELRDAPSDEKRAEMATWLLNSLQRLIDSIYRADLVREEVLAEDDVVEPRQEVIERLTKLGKAERERHNRTGRTNNYRQQQAQDRKRRESNCAPRSHDATTRPYCARR